MLNLKYIVNVNSNIPKISGIHFQIRPSYDHKYKSMYIANSYTCFRDLGYKEEASLQIKSNAAFPFQMLDFSA